MNLYESMNKYFEKSFDLKEEDKQEPIKEARGSYKLAVQQALLDADLQLPDVSPMNKKAQEEAVAKAIDVLKTAKAKTDDKKELEAYNRALMILEHRPTPIAFSSLGAWYSGISMSESRRPKEGCKKIRRMKESKYHDKPGLLDPDAGFEREERATIRKALNKDRKSVKEDLGADIEKYQKYVDYDMKNYGRISNRTQRFIDEAGLQVIKDQYGDYEVTAGRYVENYRRNRKMKESRYHYFSRKPLRESQRSVSKKKLGEALLDTVDVDKWPEDIDKLQKLVDWDLDHLGYVKTMTKEKINKYGYKIVKDPRPNRKSIFKVVDIDYPDDEYYRESCKSRKAQKKLTEEKKDLWDTIYGELTEDGSQYIAPETGKPRINKGAGYKFDDQIAVDRAGNIVVKVKEERDLKAAIDIADSHKDEGVTYNISESKYDKRYPYWMTIEIPQENLHESKITEKRWRYQVSDKVAREFRDAVNADDDDYERVRKAILAIYDDIHDNSNLLDDDDYEDWTEEVKDIDLDDEESAQSELNFELSNLYDFCDNASIWIGI